MSSLIKNKYAFNIVDQILKSLDLEMDECFPYDPHMVISNLSVSFNSSEYVTTIDSTLASLAKKEICINHSPEKEFIEEIQIAIEEYNSQTTTNCKEDISSYTNTNNEKRIEDKENDKGKIKN